MFCNYIEKVVEVNKKKFVSVGLQSGKPTVHKSVLLTEEIAASLEHTAHELRKSQAQVIREAVDMYIEQHKMGKEIDSEEYWNEVKKRCSK